MMENQDGKPRMTYIMYVSGVIVVNSSPFSSLSAASPSTGHEQ